MKVTLDTDALTVAKFPAKSEDPEVQAYQLGWNDAIDVLTAGVKEEE